MWQGARVMMDYKKNDNHTERCNPSLAEDLNRFFARFADNNIRVMDRLPPDHQTIILDSNEVRRALGNINTTKAARPDGVPGQIDQLAEVFTNIFNLSLNHTVVPTCLKATTIVPIPKQKSKT